VRAQLDYLNSMITEEKCRQGDPKFP
jgi:hypothetical protein